MTNDIGMIVEGLVAILLVLTIGYCMLLNRRLKRLRSDEKTLRATIGELVTATETAERAIGGLKRTVEETELGLAARLRSADSFTADLDRSIASGKEVLDRLSQIVGACAPAGLAAAAPAPASAARPRYEEPNVHAHREAGTGQPDPRAVAAAAQAFAERLRMKVYGLAA